MEIEKMLNDYAIKVEGCLEAGMRLDMLSCAKKAEEAKQSKAEIIEAWEAMEKRIAELEAVLTAYESWEAELILSDESWDEDNLPHLTQLQFDRLIDIQTMRNKALYKKQS